ncbi:HalOD1 output domain-containing protein [Haloarcula amylovorans]|uniref:HalOD1 output domain-containing protein n=1 Tax=Haloarcula amylovorans TaxID=2562280 RepID=UPI001076ABB9|nr:HalOD1 output domain-containing protein [Halomicroarcula amylolytica]
MHENVERRSLSADQPLSESVARAIADAEDIEPAQVASRVYDVVDPDALDRLFRPANDQTRREDAQLFFRLDDYEITIQGGELVVVRPARPAESLKQD